MIELSSQQQKEQQLPPRAVQIVSHPFFGRVVLTAGPAQFGMDLSKHKAGVCEMWVWSVPFPVAQASALQYCCCLRASRCDQLITVVKMTGPSGDNDSSDSRGDEWLICLCSAPESSAMV